MDLEEKQGIREEMRKSLRELGAEGAAEMSYRLVTSLAAWLISLSPKPASVALFAPLAGEPDLRSLHQLCPEMRFHYPRVVGRDLRFHEVCDPKTMKVASFGIREPDTDHHPAVSTASIDVFLCPGLAFSPHGARLGRGMGFYDRALAKSRTGACMVGTAFARQVRLELPVAGHDYPMDYMATESGVTRCG